MSQYHTRRPYEAPLIETGSPWWLAKLGIVLGFPVIVIVAAFAHFWLRFV